MRLYIDCIYTQRPTHCASHVKMRKIVRYLLDRHPDLMIYWQRPADLDADSLAAFPDDPRIEFIEYPYVTIDRLREYLRCNEILYKNLNFQGKYWDTDILITNRASMVPVLKALMQKPGRFAYDWSKRIFLIEDMPLMDFKLTVPISAPVAQTLQSLVAYATAETTAISAFWEKAVILKEAAQYLAPAQIRQIQKRMIESTPVIVDKTELKTKAAIEPMLKGERPFTIGFVGRMTHATRSEEIFEMMTKHWIYRAGEDRKIRCLASTQSTVKPGVDGKVTRVGRVRVPEWLEVKNLPREGFWNLMRTEVDVIVFLSPEEDYSMSLMEPLILGTPAVLIDARWSRPSVGQDYPFFVKDIEQAYSMVRMFYENYPAMYKRFAEWSRQSFMPLLQSRNSTYVPLLVEQEMAAWQKGFEANTAKDTLINNEVVAMLDAHGRANGNELVVWDAIEALDKAGKLGHLAVKMGEHFLETRKLTFGTDWNIFRLGLMLRGWRDASVKVGHMKCDG